MSCRQPPSSPCCLRPEPIIVFKVKPLQYKTFTNTLQFASHLPIWSLCQPWKGVLFSLLSRCGNWTSEIWSRWIISRKVGTGTQAFKVQHPLFPLPMKHKLTNGSLRSSQQWAGSQQCLDYLWLQPSTSSMWAAFLTLSVPGPQVQTLQVREPHTQEQLTPFPSHPGKEFVTHPAASEWVSEWKLLSCSLQPHRLQPMEFSWPEYQSG